MARKILSLVLILALLPACLAVPVMADDSDDGWFDLLDYGTPNNSINNNYSFIGSGVVTFSSPTRLFGAFVELTFYSNRIITSVVCSDGTSLSIEKYDDYYYRVYGQLSDVSLNDLTFSASSLNLRL